MVWSILADCVIMELTTRPSRVSDWRAIAYRTGKTVAECKQRWRVVHQIHRKHDDMILRLGRAIDLQDTAELDDLSWKQVRERFHFLTQQKLHAELSTLLTTTCLDDENGPSPPRNVPSRARACLLDSFDDHDDYEMEDDAPRPGLNVRICGRVRTLSPQRKRLKYGCWNSTSFFSFTG